MLVMIVEIVDQFPHPLKGIPFLVEREYGPLVHIVDIGPHGFQGNARFAVVSHHFSNLIHVLVAVFALVVLAIVSYSALYPDDVWHTYSECPIALHGGKSDDLGVLDTGFLGSLSIEEVKVKHTAKDVIF